ncbi:hypothetical protein DFH09DRAFT_272453 [Mycena vulgaris]|nr:hypothetical protein DFH09DRAFT_272453 [Mycena vulgaris]
MPPSQDRRNTLDDVRQSATFLRNATPSRHAKSALGRPFSSSSTFPPSLAPRFFHCPSIFHVSPASRTRSALSPLRPSIHTLSLHSTLASPSILLPPSSTSASASASLSRAPSSLIHVPSFPHPLPSPARPLFCHPLRMLCTDHPPIPGPAAQHSFIPDLQTTEDGGEGMKDVRPERKKPRTSSSLPQLVIFSAGMHDVPVRARGRACSLLCHGTKAHATDSAGDARRRLQCSHRDPRRRRVHTFLWNRQVGSGGSRVGAS